jgi:hypothetical protein
VVVQGLESSREESFLICKGASNNLHLFGRGQLFLVGVGAFLCPPIPFPWLPVHSHGRSASATSRPRIRPGQPHGGFWRYFTLFPSLGSYGSLSCRSEVYTTMTDRRPYSAPPRDPPGPGPVSVHTYLGMYLSHSSSIIGAPCSRITKLD